MHLEPHGVEEALFKLSRIYGKTILLLDRFGQDPLGGAIEEVGEPAPRCLPLNDEIFRNNLAKAPLLVELSESLSHHAELCQLSVEIARRETSSTSGSRAVCAWIFSKAPLERIQHDLRNRLNARYPRHRIYFRYFDPRVMPRLAEILAPTNPTSTAQDSCFADVLGPIEVWCHLDHDGRLLRHDNPSPHEIRYLPQLHFCRGTASKIDRIEGINLAFRQIIRRGHSSKAEIHVEIDAHLVDAAKFGLVSVEDQVAYAWRSSIYGREFANHPEMKEWIGEAESLGFPLENFLADKLPMIK